MSPFGFNKGRRLLDRLDAFWPWAVRGFVIVGITFLVLPMLIVIGTSFGTGYRVTFPPATWTFQSYLTIPGSFISAFFTSVGIACVSVVIGILFSVPAAFALVRGWLPGRGPIETFLRSPLQVPRIILGVAFFQYYVFVGQTFGIGLRGTLLGMLFAHTLIITPYMLVTIVGRVATGEPTLEEAAYGLGASFMHTMIRVTLPLMKPAIIAGTILGFLVSFNDVVISMFLASAGANTLPVEMLGVAENELTPVLYAVASISALLSVTVALLVEKWVGLRTAVMSV